MCSVCITDIIISTVVVAAVVFCCGFAVRKLCPAHVDLRFDDVFADDFAHQRPEFSLSVMRRINAVKVH
jgi:predicted metal-binding transcription factor (methanogenesis marker protein 9)